MQCTIKIHHFILLHTQEAASHSRSSKFNHNKQSACSEEKRHLDSYTTEKLWKLFLIFSILNYDLSSFYIQPWFHLVAHSTHNLKGSQDSLRFTRLSPQVHSTLVPLSCTQHSPQHSGGACWCHRDPRSSRGGKCSESITIKQDSSLATIKVHLKNII